MPPYKNLPEAKQVEQAAGLLKQRDDGAWEWKMDREPTRLRRSGRLPPLPDLWDGVARITCPTLIIWGETSHVLDEAQVKRMLEVMPNAQAVMVPRVGHTPWLSEPEAIAALKRFLVQE